jgi:hypothetical protein
MLPVASLNGSKIGTGSVPGEIFTKLLRTWGENQGVNIEAQIKSWATTTSGTGPTPYQFKPAR